MQELAVSPLKAWDNFCVIVASAAAGLTGLQFVVMTLIAEAGGSRRRHKESVAAFGSPTIVHFCAALLAASILSAPWPALREAGLALAGCGVLGTIYVMVVLRRAARQRGYRPVAEDWVWHIALPAVAYLSLLVGGVALGPRTPDVLFAVGAAMLLLVFIGIHNAWDSVIFMQLEGPPGSP